VFKTSRGVQKPIKSRQLQGYTSVLTTAGPEYTTNHIEMASQRRANRAGGPRVSQQTGEEQDIWQRTRELVSELDAGEVRIKEIGPLVVEMEARFKLES
jgi:hypothetical protein